jgi:hypothetical protein
MEPSSPISATRPLTPKASRGTVSNLETLRRAEGFQQQKWWIQLDSTGKNGGLQLFIWDEIFWG